MSKFLTPPNIRDQYTLPSSAGSNGQVLTMGTGTTTSWTTPSSGGGITGSGTNNYVPLWNGTSALDTSSIQQNATGIGIGKAATSTLEIAGSSKASGASLTLTNTFNGSGWVSGDIVGSLDFRSDDVSTTQPIRGRIRVIDDASSSTTYPAYNAMVFSTSNLNTLTERLRITSSGNVGINQNNPTEKLAVTGNIECTESSAGTKIAFNAGDTFTIGSTATAHYGMTCGNTASNPVVLSGYNGVALATQGAFRVSVLQNGDVGIGDTTPSYKLDVAGTIRATGDVIAYSDARVKENVETISEALETVKKLRGVSFNKIGEESRSIGVIAQETEDVVPEVVKTDGEGMKAVAYGNLVGLLIEAIKEQEEKIDRLSATLELYIKK